MKCPACGFETPDSQAWCDFCKEPFRRPAPKAQDVPNVPISSEAPPSAAVKPDAVSPAVPLDASSVKDMPPEKLAELLKMDASAERVPAVPDSTRRLAWAFLAVVGLMMLVLSLVAIRKAKRGDIPVRAQPAPEETAAPELPSSESQVE